MFELTEVMHQRGDSQLIHLLNNVSTAKLNSRNINIIQSRIIQPEYANYPKDVLHIYAENANANSYNQAMLESIDNLIYYIKAIDNLLKNVSIQKINEVLNQNQSETGGLAGFLKIKINARDMLTVNIDLQYRLVNGQLGTIIDITGNSQGISKIYLKFDDTRAGVKAFNADIFGKQNSWGPIEKTEVDIKIKLSKNPPPVIKRTQYPLMLAWGCT